MCIATDFKRTSDVGCARCLLNIHNNVGKCVIRGKTSLVQTNLEEYYSYNFCLMFLSFSKVPSTEVFQDFCFFLPHLMAAVRRLSNKTGR